MLWQIESLDNRINKTKEQVADYKRRHEVASLMGNRYAEHARFVGSKVPASQYKSPQGQLFMRLHEQAERWLRTSVHWAERTAGAQDELLRLLKKKLEQTVGEG